MAFNSFEFLAFICLVVPLFYMARPRQRLGLLLAASYAYYVLAAGAYALLLLLSSALVFWLARALQRAPENHRRRFVVAGSAVVLAALVLLKYTPELAAGAGSGGLARWGAIAAPLGISYYSFKLISYLIDVRRGRMEATASFPAFATYAAFFPQIPSGPIQRAHDFLPQVETEDGESVSLIRSGVLLATIGFVKKLVFADRIALAIAPVFADPASSPPPAVLLAAYLFTLQLYLDFSGLTDIAIGIGRILQIRAPRNFTDPFFAVSVQEFWSRWHMTLTGWLRDYVFLPLNMALRDWGRLGLSIAVAVNMLLIALWHGATLPFVVFGLLHAAYLVCGLLSRGWRDRLWARSRRLASLRRVGAPLVTFHLVVIAFVFFRAASFSLALTMIERASWAPVQGRMPPLGLLAVLLAGAAATVVSHLLDRRPTDLQVVGWRYAALVIVLLVVLYAFAPAESVSFVYVGF